VYVAKNIQNVKDRTSLTSVARRKARSVACPRRMTVAIRQAVKYQQTPCPTFTPEKPLTSQG
jgi:hypothetical protein